MAFLGGVYAIAMCLIILPVAHVFLVLAVPPEAIALHGPILEVPNVVLIKELHHALAMGFVIGEITHVD